MTCNHLRDNLFSYLDGDLDAASLRSFEAHLTTCAACRGELEKARQSESALASAPRTVPPAGDLRSGFYARLAAPQPARTRFSGWRVALPALAAACVLGVLYVRAQTPKLPEEHTLAFIPHPGFPYKAPIIAASKRPATTLALTDAVPEVAPPALPKVQPEPNILRVAKASAPPSLPLRTAPHLFKGKSEALQVAWNVPSPVRLRSELSFSAFGNRQPLLNEPLSSASAATDVYREDLSSVRRLRDEQTLMLAKSADAPEETVELRVQDDVRGFTNTAHIAGGVEEQDGDTVVKIEAEDGSASDEPSTNE